jgi:hypothetical protein
MTRVVRETAALEHQPSTAGPRPMECGPSFGRPSPGSLAEEMARNRHTPETVATDGG